MSAIRTGSVLIIATAALAVGASLKTPPAKPKAAPKTPTYAKDVAPILNSRCVSCHRPGEVAPFSLVGYENAKKWSGMVAGVTARRQMPPWKAVDGFGEFREENRLSSTELEILQNWHKTGASRGEKAKEPAPPKFSSEWTLGKPDMVLSMDRKFKLEAEGADVYRNFVLKNEFKEPVWVKAIDVRPGNKRVVHHVIAYLDNSGMGRKLEAAQNDGQDGYLGTGGGVGFLPSGALGGWAPGVRPIPSDAGTAFRIAPGAQIVMQVHYHKSGKPEEDQTKLALYFAKEPIEKEIRLHWMLNFNLDIPPGKKEHSMRHSYTYRKDETIYTVMPHMHLLGKSMKSWLEFPDGTKRPLVHVNDWDFNWQLIYTLKEPIKVPKGTKQIIEATYDNTAENPNNPSNPPRRVRWGEETTDEMFLLITAYTVDAETQSASGGK